jgi:hypothetical protein
MKNFLSVIAVVSLTALLVTACPNEPKKPPRPNTGGEQYVTGITLQIARVPATGTPTWNSGKPDSMAPGQSRLVRANVSQVGGVATTYKIDFTSGKDTVATLTPHATAGWYTLTVKADAAENATFTIEAVTDEKDKDGEQLKASWAIKILPDPTEVPVAEWKLELWNHASIDGQINDAGGTPGAKFNAMTAEAIAATGTTTTLPAAADKRYIIKNNIPTATFNSSDVAGGIYSVMREATFVYLNKAFAVSDEATTYGMEMRVKMLGNGATPPTGVGVGSNTAQGLLVAAFNKPQNFVTGTSALEFAGIQYTISGRHSRFTSRSNNAPSAGDFSTGGPYAAALRMHDNAVTKTEGFSDQEFVYKITCYEAGKFYIDIYSPDGLSLYARYDGSRGGQDVGDYLANPDNPVYLGFAVMGATVEISGIKYFEGDTKWEDTATKDATLAPINVKEIKIVSDPARAPTATADYTQVFANFPDDGVQLSVQTVPRSVADVFANSAWEITSGGTIGDITNDGLVTLTTFGQIVAKATISGAMVGNGTKTAEFKFNILEFVPDVASVTVSGRYTELEAGVTGKYTGGKLTLTAKVTESALDDGITWSVTDNAGAATTAVTLTPSEDGLSCVVTGQAGTLTSDTVVKVYATSPNGAGGTSVKSSAYDITVKPWNDVKVWNFSDTEFAIYDANMATMANGVFADFSRGLLLEGNLNTGRRALTTRDGMTATYTFKTGTIPMTYHHEFNTNGAAANGNNRRRIVVPLQGPARVSVFGNANSATVTRYAAFNTDRTTAPATVTEGVGKGADGIAELAGYGTDDVNAIVSSGFFESTTAEAHEVVIWSMQSVNYLAIIVDYDPVDIPDAETVTITTPTPASVEYRSTLTMAATVAPVGALQGVTWSVWGNSAGTTETTAATINVNTGVLTPAAVATDTPVYVIASASSKPTVKSTAVTVTVKKPADPTGVTITNATPVKVTVGETLTLTATVAPNNALQTVTWAVFAADGSTATTAATIAPGTNVLTAVSAATVKVIATSTADGSKTASVDVTIEEADVQGQVKLTWNFNVLPAGWTTATNTAAAGTDPATTNVDISYGTPTYMVDVDGTPTATKMMTLLAASRTMMIRETHNTGGVIGCVQPGGTGNFATISGIPAGSFKVNAKYSNTGGDAAAATSTRYVTVTRGSGEGSASTADNCSGPAAASGSASTPLTQLNWTYEGTAGGDITLACAGNSVRLYELTITYIVEEE